MFEEYFLTDKEASRAAYRSAIHQAAALLADAANEAPYSGRNAKELDALFAANICPPEPASETFMAQQLERVIEHSIHVNHVNCAAHLHCAPLIPALAAEVVLTALNQSMDSFDQAPAATVIELQLLRWLCAQVGLPPSADGTMTAGGSQSNYMGLWLARDYQIERLWNWSAQERGLPPDARRLRILCSEMAHFTVEKSAAQLGLGSAAVIKVPVDGAFRMDTAQLERALCDLREQDLVAMAIVGTAGTTDFGSIDPLDEIAHLARQYHTWFHVDAAYGGALLFSSRAARLDGLRLADSITMDFHKLFWQPVSCGAFLVRDGAVFDLIRLHADYLNPAEHQELGIPDLVTRSALTTRRFDALKLWLSLRALGRRKLVSMIDTTLDLAQGVAERIENHPRLRLVNSPELGCVVFRYRAQRPDVNDDFINGQIPKALFNKGHAVIGHTTVRGQPCLKLTILNPCSELSDLIKLIDLIGQEGQLHEAEAIEARRSAAAVSRIPAENNRNA